MFVFFLFPFHQMDADCWASSVVVMNIKWNASNERHAKKSCSSNRFKCGKNCFHFNSILKINERKKTRRNETKTTILAGLWAIFVGFIFFGACDFRCRVKSFWSVLIWNSNKMKTVFCSLFFFLASAKLFCKSIEKRCPSRLIMDINYECGVENEEKVYASKVLPAESSSQAIELTGLTSMVIEISVHCFWVCDSISNIMNSSRWKKKLSTSELCWTFAHSSMREFLFPSKFLDKSMRQSAFRLDMSLDCAQTQIGLNFFFTCFILIFSFSIYFIRINYNFNSFGMCFDALWPRKRCDMVHTQKENEIKKKFAWNWQIYQFLLHQ